MNNEFDARLEAVERELAETRWCFAEFVWQQKVASIRTVMSNPKVMDLMAQRIASMAEKQGAQHG